MGWAQPTRLKVKRGPGQEMSVLRLPLSYSVTEPFQFLHLLSKMRALSPGDFTDGRENEMKLYMSTLWLQRGLQHQAMLSQGNFDRVGQ
jgi:hypothetical protein